MRLRDLEFRLTLGTTQDLAFFDFVFVHIDFGGTFWTTDHGAILRRVVRKWRFEAVPHHCAAYYIPRYIIRCTVVGDGLEPPLANNSTEDGAVIRCPECSAEIDVDEDEVEEGEILSCPECESELEVSQTHPVHLNLIADDEDEEDDEEEEGKVGENGDLIDDDDDEEEEEEDEE